MALSYAAYFRTAQDNLKSVVDFLLSEKMICGGFNCRSNSSGAIHSSLHSTLLVLGGIIEYKLNGYKYRISKLEQVKTESQELSLASCQLFRDW